MNRTRGAWFGAFVLGGLLLFAVALFMIGDRRSLFSKQVVIGTTYDKVTGLQIGTRVRLAGLDVGEVLEIRVPPRPSEKFLVHMQIRDELRPLVRTDSVTAIQTDGIVGAAFIQISAGTDDAPVIEPGGLLVGRDPIEFADLIQQGRDTFELVSREVVGLTGDVSVALASLTKTVDTTESVIAKVGNEVEKIGNVGVRVVNEAESMVGDVRGIVNGVRAGEGSIGKLFNDTAFYDRMNAIGQEAANSARVVRETAETTKAAVESFVAPGGAGPQMTQNIRNTLAGIEEVTSDLGEGTEALKRNFIFRGFFRSRGFFDLDSMSREAYQAGLLERDNRTAVRVWLNAALLFERDADGNERLTTEGRRRLDSAMAQFVQYPRDSPLIVEGYAQGTDEATAYLVSVERGTVVRDYVLSRFRRQATLTDVMPLSDEAIGSPSGDGKWAGVALAMYVRNDVFRIGGNR